MFSGNPTKRARIVSEVQNFSEMPAGSVRATVVFVSLLVCAPNVAD
jgi:hypothetical protein